MAVVSMKAHWYSDVWRFRTARISLDKCTSYYKTRVFSANIIASFMQENIEKYTYRHGESLLLILDSKILR